MSDGGYGLSCEPVNLPSCVHGVVDYCHKCQDRFIDQVIELAKQVNALTDMYKSVSIQCAANHEHKLRQIDENRKISRRVDELEKWKEVAIEKNIQDIARIRELEKQINDVIDIHVKVEKLEKNIVDYSDIEEIHRILKEHYKQIFHKEKKPHRCPVCDGSVKILIDPSTPMSGIQAMFGKRDENGMYYQDCKSCEGNGIVWG